MNDLLIIGGTLGFLGFIAYWFFKPKKRPPLPDFPVKWQKSLQKSVRYYRRLKEPEKRRFEKLVQRFLQEVTITGVKTTVDDLDRLLIASSAVIPIFGFKNWSHYPNIDEVLLYPNAFNGDNFQTKGKNRRVLGMVGWSYMNGKMILSKQALRKSFLQGGKSNVGIHEFIHLLDKMDGAVDGLPDYLLARPYSVPWLHLLHVEIQKIRTGKSDLNSYGGTSEIEFLAVAGEYFFQRPDRLQKKHSELYKILERIFNQDLDEDGIGE